MLAAALLLAATLSASGSSGQEPAQRETCAAPGTPTCGRPRVRGERPLPTWQQVATEDDRRRLREWRDAWVAALAEARGSGFAADIAREGPLLDPDAALPDARLPAGDYRCRTIKIGSQGTGLLDYVAYPEFRCRVAPGADGLMNFTKLTGSQRPVGRIYDEQGRRQIFLGTMQLSDERAVLSYGRDRERNLAGVVERVGARRWRIAFPFPHFESTLDVIELVPVS